jgi:hypothetical protein
MTSLAVVIASSTLLLVTLVARAHHLPFTDVPTSGVVHDAVGWLYTRGITTGCTATLYCPNDPVTRASMALFMNRLGKVLSPVYRWVESDSGALDIDASPRICSTGDFTPSFPMRALVIGTVSLEAGGPLGASLDLIVSTNSGATWSPIVGFFSRVGASAAGEWDTATKTAFYTLSPGTPYRFAIQLFRQSGTADANASRCNLMVQFTNRNPDGILPDAASDAPAAGHGEKRR